MTAIPLQDKQREDEKRAKLHQERVEEQKRLEREADQRQKEKKKQEIEEMQLKIKQEKVDQLKNTAVGKRAFADITNEVHSELWTVVLTVDASARIPSGPEEHGCRGHLLQTAEAD